MLCNMRVHNPSNLPVIDYRLVDELQGNLKDLSETNFKKLKNVLIKRGFSVPLFLWHQKKPDKWLLLDGHQRLRVMKHEQLNDAGSYEVPYVEIPAADLKEARERLLEITSQYGHMTIEGLEEFAFDLDLSELDINFDAIDMDALLGEEEEVEEDEPPAVDDSSQPVSKLGEVYQLGRHRLMCGDNKDNTVLNGANVDLVLTDPPYGIGDLWVGGKGHGWGKAREQGGKRNDWDGEAPPKAYFDKLLEVGEHQVIWGGNYFDLPVSRGWLVWNKPERNFSLAEAELAWTSKDMVIRVGDFNRSDPGREHPTQKPVKLMAWCLSFFDKAKTIYDPFGGSGSTLIACEQTDRTCYMMELDPKYCDVIRKRYANFVEAEDWEAATPRAK